MNTEHFMGVLDLVGQQHRLIEALQVENSNLRAQLAEAAQVIDPTDVVID